MFISCPTFVSLEQILMHVKLQFREDLQVKVKGKVSGFPHMICLSFIERMYEKSDAEIGGGG